MATEPKADVIQTDTQERWLPPKPAATRRSVDVSKPVTDFDDAWRCANAMVESHTFCGKHATVAQCQCAILFAGQYGILAMNAPMVVDVIEGKPCFSSIGMLGLCQGFPAFDHDRHTEGYEGTFPSDDFAAIVTCARKGSAQFYTGRFSIGDAIRAGLVSRDDKGKLARKSTAGKPLPWELYAKDMLLARARPRALRPCFADRIAGIYAREELTAADILDQIDLEPKREPFDARRVAVEPVKPATATEALAAKLAPEPEPEEAPMEPVPERAIMQAPPCTDEQYELLREAWAGLLPEQKAAFRRDWKLGVMAKEWESAIRALDSQQAEALFEQVVQELSKRKVE